MGRLFKTDLSSIGLRAKRKTFRRSKDECQQHVGVLKYTGTLTFIFILSVLIVSMFFMIILADIRNIKGNYVGTKTSQEINTLLMIKESVESTSTANLKEVANNIRQDIINTMDMDKLEQELNKGNIPKELSDIFYKYLNGYTSIKELDANTNNVIVCMQDGIIEDFSKVYATPDTETTRDWESEKVHEANPELYSTSLQALLKQDTNIFYAEQYKYSEYIEKADQIVYMDKDIFGDIYSEKGLEGLREYTFWVPVYIDKDGDIFGKADIKNGHSIKNNKFIIIQRYKLYDYIKHRNLDSSFGSNVIRQLDKLVITIQLGGLIIIILLLIIVTALVHNINVISDGDNISKKDTQEDDQENTE